MACLALSGCGGFSSTPPSTQSFGPAPTADVLRPGDKVTIRITGVPAGEGDNIEKQLPENGNITVPLLAENFHAAGKSTGDLAEEITEAYKTQKIYSNPDVTVISEERYVSVGGDVRNPMRVQYTSDLTLLTAINSCGGFTDYAKRNAVRILRGQQVIYVNATSAVVDVGADPILYPGDQVYVPRTIF